MTWIPNAKRQIVLNTELITHRKQFPEPLNPSKYLSVVDVFAVKKTHTNSLNDLILKVLTPFYLSPILSYHHYPFSQKAIGTAQTKYRTSPPGKFEILSKNGINKNWEILTAFFSRSSKRWWWRVMMAFVCMSDICVYILYYTWTMRKRIKLEH